MRRSDKHGGLGQPDKFAEWLGQVLDHLHIEQARVVGIPYGGYIAANFALPSPARVSRLILLCPAGTLAPLSRGFFIRALLPLILKMPIFIRSYWRWFLHNQSNSSHPFTDLFVMSWQSFIPRGFVIPHVFSHGDLRSITAPTTVLIGEHDVIYQHGAAGALQRARTAMPNVRTHLIAHAGHIQTLDNPDTVSQRILEGLH